MWFNDLRIIEDEQIHKITPELIAEIFCSMDSEKQAAFFNAVSEIASKWQGMGWFMQLQYITDEHGLTLGGRRVMQGIGEYSHWGLVPQAKG